MPYHVLGARSGALAVTMAWMRVAMERSGSGMAAILASRALSPSAFRDSAFSSAARSFIAARSASEKPPDFCFAFVGLIAASLC